LARFADRVRSLPVVLAFRAETRETEAIGAAAQGVSGAAKGSRPSKAKPQ
jgi:hypothetical protein